MQILSGEAATRARRSPCHCFAIVTGKLQSFDKWGGRPGAAGEVRPARCGRPGAAGRRLLLRHALHRRSPTSRARPARTRAAIVGELTREGSKRYKLKAFVTVAQNEAAYTVLSSLVSTTASCRIACYETSRHASFETVLAPAARRRQRPLASTDRRPIRTACRRARRNAVRRRSQPGRCTPGRARVSTRPRAGAGRLSPAAVAFHRISDV